MFLHHFELIKKPLANELLVNTNRKIFQLNFTFQHGLEAVRILLLDGFNKSATYVNSAKHIEQIG